MGHSDIQHMHRPSLDPDEVAKFTAMADAWWDPKGKFRPLHKFNPVRLTYIRDAAVRHFGLDDTARRPFEGLTLLDIGCGGGLVSEPMTRLGATVTGVDASEANIKTALTHAEQGGLEIDYRAGTAEALIEAGEGPYDIVLNLEVVEHVADPGAFLADTANLVKPEQLEVLRGLIALQKQAAENLDSRSFIEHDEAFHKAIADIIDSDYAWKIVEAARFQTDRVRMLSLPEASPLPRLIRQHEAILHGLETGDGDAASNATRRHLREILIALPRIAAAHPDLFSDSQLPEHCQHLVPEDC